MSKTRKILSVVLALVMVFSLATVAFAVDYEEADSTNAQTWALGTPVANGNNWDIPVNLTTNYATGAIQFDLAYDSVTFVSAKIGSAVYYAADFQPAVDGSRFVIVPDTSSLEDSTATIINGTIATITVSGTSGSVTLKNNPKTATNTSGTLIAVRVDDGDLITGNLVAGQKVNATANVATIGAQAEPADLAVTDGYNVVIDTNKTFKGAYTGVVYGFTQTAANDFFLNKNKLAAQIYATNEGTLAFAKPNGGTTGTGWGTGSTVEVFNKDGSSTGKKYVIVIFGDVNGDGKINNSDVASGLAYMTNGLNTPARIATNCYQSTAATINYNVQNNDIAQLLKLVSSGINSNQATLATKHAAGTHANYK